jgi:CRP-like cAMP-binding protein
MAKSASLSHKLFNTFLFRDDWYESGLLPDGRAVMPTADQTTVQNRLLKALPREAFALFAPDLEFVELPVKHVLVEADQPTSHVCFMESGLASMVATTTEDESVEIGHIGREGMTGEHVVLWAENTPNRTFLQVAGAGYLMPAETLKQILSDNPAVQPLFLRYIHSANLQMAHSALANARYSVYERLARWLLMVHDRLDGDDLPLTHEFLSLMLGVRRSGVTDQIHILEGGHAIKATRGNIRVLDREKLREIADGCYGVPEREYERLIGLSLSAHPRG